MKLYYDLHIHSALSPCGDNDMTPNNIVNMAIIKGLGVIAVTDHNSAGNVRAVTNVAKDDILVIPGMEVTTSEEVHVLCYFPTVDAAEDMGKLVYDCLPQIKNKAEIFGNQYYMDENDVVKREEERLLISATSLNIYKVKEEAEKRGGIMVPAHVDKSSYSVHSNLGFMPPDLHISSVEITHKNIENMKIMYPGYNLFISSDAHYLEDISEPERVLDILDKKPGEFVKNLSKIK